MQSAQVSSPVSATLTSPEAKRLSSTLAGKLPKLTPRRRHDADESANPPPPTPALAAAPDLDGHRYETPARRILSPRDHELFLQSETYQLVVSFVFTLSDSVRNKTTRSVAQGENSSSPVILSLLDILRDADELLKACPRIETASRFGNPAFRDYLSGIEKKAVKWHQGLGIQSEEAITEVSMYLIHAFGSGSRIDYGSGHELNFVIWLLCLRQMSLIGDDLFPQLALVVFPSYLNLMRDIQSTYYLEPAGSHGVWGLDDYQFLPFLFGASQLVGHKHIRPLSIHNEPTIEECSRDYLYLDQIKWVNATKTVQGLRWHSPMLDDISAAKSWAKVEGGMRKMFLAEVLGKLPVAQHFLFGSLLQAQPGMTSESSAEGRHDHDHEHEHDTPHAHDGNSWGDCCGIKVPSAVGARQEASRHGASSSLRRIPFD